jgi:phage terminase large subunit-like protein
MSEVKAELAEIAAEALEDPVYFCEFFLPHMFPGPMPWVHRGLLAILTRRTKFLAKYGDLDKIVRNFVYIQGGKEHQIFHRRPDGSLYMILGKYTLIMLPRGFSKTTIAGNAVPLYNILFHEVPFSVYVSESATHAQMQLDNIKRELEGNERILAVFGRQRPERAEPGRWAADEFETIHGMAMAAKGRGSQIRGVKHREHRPRVIIFDDLEDKESVSTEEQRKKVRSWFYGDLLPALPEMDQGATVVGLGTLLHPDALLAYLARDPQWTTVRFGVKDKDGEWLWPANINETKYEVKKRSAVLAGELSTFYMEYDNVFRSDESAKFKQAYVRVVEMPKRADLQVAVFCDPAIGERDSADFAAFAAVGIAAGGKITVLDHFMKRGMSPREQVDKYFEMLKRWTPQKAGVEANAYQKALVYLIREEMFRRKFYMEIDAIFNSKSNYERINGILQPRYAAGYIVHAGHFPEYVAQLLDFPNAKHDDGPTAVAGAIALLDPYAPMAGSDDLSVDQYKPIDEELGEWRDVAI